MMESKSELIASLIRDVPDFPKPGVVFKDITPLLANPNGFSAAIEELVLRSPRDIDVVVGMEARGFLFAAPVALAIGSTAVATANLLKQLGVELVHVSVLMELSFLHGRDALTDSGIDSFSSVLTV